MTTPRVYGLSDLHMGHRENLRALEEELPERPDDWLLIAGDVGETEQHLHAALDVAQARFARVFWVPGNHELWTVPRDSGLRGVAKYERLVELCRARGVLTPEDPFVRWPDDEHATHLIAPLFVGYDYSFRAADLTKEQAIAACAERGYVCADEAMLEPLPFATREDWCAARVEESERRLDEGAASGLRLVLINHFPLRRDLARLPRLPGFEIWCGTRATADWHTRYPVDVVVTGHLHVRATDVRDGVRFEEVSLGYPRQRREGRALSDYLRPILPLPAEVHEVFGIW